MGATVCHPSPADKNDSYALNIVYVIVESYFITRLSLTLQSYHVKTVLFSFLWGENLLWTRHKQINLSTPAPQDSFVLNTTTTVYPPPANGLISSNSKEAFTRFIVECAPTNFISAVAAPATGAPIIKNEDNVMGVILAINAFGCWVWGCSAS